MSFFDSLKNRATQAQPGSGGQNLSVTLSDIPVSLSQLQAMPEAALTRPEHTAALVIASLCVYPANKEAALEMLTFLHGPKGLSAYDKQFIADRFHDKDYVPRSYFRGATPENNYEPAKPYTLDFFENPYSRDQLKDGYLTLHIRSGGADSPRQIKLRNKPSTGQWFLWEQFLLSDIRKPVSLDPWA